MTPQLSKTTWRCCCLGCSVWAACWTSSQRCRSFPGHTLSAVRREGDIHLYINLNFITRGAAYSCSFEIIHFPFIYLFFYLQLFLIEGFEQVLRNNLIEAFLQSQKLSLDAMQETPVHIQPAKNMKVKGRGRNPKGVFIDKASVWTDTDNLYENSEKGVINVGWKWVWSYSLCFYIPDILLLGVLWDGDTLAVGFQFMLDDFSVGIVLHTESVVQHASDVIVPEEGGG